jgi:hypothetical protein
MLCVLGVIFLANKKEDSDMYLYIIPFAGIALIFGGIIPNSTNYIKEDVTSKIVVIENTGYFYSEDYPLITSMRQVHQIKSGYSVLKVDEIPKSMFGLETNKRKYFEFVEPSTIEKGEVK